VLRAPELLVLPRAKVNLSVALLLLKAFQYLKGAYRTNGEKHFSKACCERTRSNGLKLREGRFRLDRGKKIFTVRVVKHWNMLPIEVVEAPSLETFKVRLDGAQSNLI